jgi:hypothetical protein
MSSPRISGIPEISVDFIAVEFISIAVLPPTCFFAVDAKQELCVNCIADKKKDWN